MSEFQDMLKMELRKAIINNGYRVAENKSRYSSWEDYTAGNCERFTALTKFTNNDPVDDVQWRQWEGTFDPDVQHYGIELYISALDERWRYEGTITKLLQELLR